MTALPVAGRAHVRRAVFRLIRDDRGAVALMVLLNALAAIAGLGTPTRIGRPTVSTEGASA
ncbi:ABC transporter ATP-binding protein, partial [Actinoplanes sp. NPDC026623]